MIGTFRDRYLERFYREDVLHRRIPAALCNSLYRRLQVLDVASRAQDLYSPPSNRCEKLAGHLQDWYSIRVNNQWRLIFQWDEARAQALNVYLDNHSYR